MKCDGDCFDCKYPDCMASEEEVLALDRAERKAARAERRQRRGSPPGDARERHNAARRKYYAGHRIEETERAERWNAAHREKVREYNREWMRTYRARQKEVAG